MTLLGFLARFRCPAHLRGRVPHDGGVGVASACHVTGGGIHAIGASHPAHPLFGACLCDCTGAPHLVEADCPPYHRPSPAVTVRVRDVGETMVEVRYEGGLACPDPERALLASIPTIFEAEALGVAREWLEYQNTRRVYVPVERPTPAENARRYSSERGTW